ncbi:MAG: HTTM domain-containing protein [Candidatus Limnocylindria bacterium]
MNRLKDVVERTVSSRAAGLARMAVGLAAAVKAVELAPVLTRFAEPGPLRIPYAEGLPTVADLPAAAVTLVWLLAALAFAAGATTAVTGTVLVVVLAAVLASDQQLYSNHLYLLTLLVALLTLARAGAALSVDARRGGGRDRIADWPLQLVRAQVSIVYLFAALAKVTGVYLSGSVVAVTLRRDGPLAIPAEWRVFELMAAAAMLAILVELWLSIALWRPRWRPAAFATGFLMHVGIAVWFAPTIQLVIFSLIILAPYVLFLDAQPASRVAVWDDSCGFCRGTIGWARRLDWLHAIRFVPGSDTAAVRALGISQEEADRALQLRFGGVNVSGFRAVSAMLEVLPVSFLWAPLLRLPPVRAVGDAAYRRVAQRRMCSVMAGLQPALAAAANVADRGVASEPPTG